MSGFFDMDENYIKEVITAKTDIGTCFSVEATKYNIRVALLKKSKDIDCIDDIISLEKDFDRFKGAKILEWSIKELEGDKAKELIETLDIKSKSKNIVHGLKCETDKGEFSLFLFYSYDNDDEALMDNQIVRNL